MSYHACVIVNPMSANGATGRHWPELRRALDRVLDRWDHHFTLHAGEASDIARRAAEEGYEMIVSVGGDGTMNEVVTGLLDPNAEDGGLIRDNLILAPVRAGTGGDFARMLGLPHGIPACVAHLEGDRTRVSDVGVVEFATDAGERGRRGFINIASFGLSGVTDEKVNTTSKAFGGRVSFFVGVCRALVAYRPQEVAIRVDGEDFYQGRLLTCAVANGQYFGGGMHFAPNAEIDDGLFDVVAHLSIAPKDFLSIGDLYNGNLVNWASVRHTRGRLVEASSPSGERVLLDVDGEQPGRLPASFRILPGAVRLKVDSPEA